MTLAARIEMALWLLEEGYIKDDDVLRVIEMPVILPK